MYVLTEVNLIKRASTRIIGHQKISRRIHRGLVATIRKISTLIAVPTANRFRKISRQTRLTATKKFNIFTSLRGDKADGEIILPRYDSIINFTLKNLIEH
jgi:hypothetical protein